MKAIMYKSIPSDDIVKNQFQKLLQKSQDRNQLHDITGYIFLSKKKIIQLIEGDDVLIDTLYNLIKIDERHFNVMTIIDKKIEKRTMKNWNMAVLDFWNDEEKFDEFKLLDTLYSSTDIELIKAFQEEILS
jgi:hypothetical protein